MTYGAHFKPTSTLLYRLTNLFLVDAHPPAQTHTHTVSIFLFSWTKISGELNQRSDSEMPLSRAGGNAPERLGDLLRGEAEAKSPTLIRKSCAGSWVQQRALNLRAVSLRLLQHPGTMWRKRSVLNIPASLCMCTCVSLNVELCVCVYRCTCMWSGTCSCAC